MYKNLLIIVTLIIFGCSAPSNEASGNASTQAPTPALSTTPKTVFKATVTPTPTIESTNTQLPVTTVSPVPSDTQNIPKAPTFTSNSAIPPQSGTCKDLKARGISDIDVAANPWASRLDRDNDGVACESRNR
ncbi:MAG: excalibur calcium-binding domain-containing protein [Calothrix sp. FI2-JRJ7]|jgi:hypothetical protein|nr:excalibur calcium-binding domain-containing protein [Calothrix sp. FI2-JRJ7]